MSPSALGVSVHVHVASIDLQRFPRRIFPKAKVAMGLEEMTKAFAEDVLRRELEISGPGRSHLAIVDLSGLYLQRTNYGQLRM